MKQKQTNRNKKLMAARGEGGEGWGDSSVTTLPSDGWLLDLEW